METRRSGIVEGKVNEWFILNVWKDAEGWDEMLVYHPGSDKMQFPDTIPVLVVPVSSGSTPAQLRAKIERALAE